MGCCRCRTSLFSFPGETWTRDCWALGMLNIRVIHRLPKDILMGLRGEFLSASLLQLCCAQDVLESSPGVRRCKHYKDSLWKPNKSFWGSAAVQHRQSQKLLFCWYIQTHTQHRPTISAVPVPCRIPLKLLRLVLLSFWEMPQKS